MEDLLLQLGVGGTVAILLVREVLNFLAKRKGDSAVVGTQPCHAIVSAVQDMTKELKAEFATTNKLLEKIVEHDEKQWDKLQEISREQQTIREDVQRCEKEVRRARRPNTEL